MEALAARLGGFDNVGASADKSAAHAPSSGSAVGTSHVAVANPDTAGFAPTKEWASIPNSDEAKNLKLMEHCDRQLQRLTREKEQLADLKIRVPQLQARVETLRGECAPLQHAYETLRFLDPSEAHSVLNENRALLEQARELRAQTLTVQSTAAGRDQLDAVTEDLSHAQAHLEKLQGDNSLLQTNLTTLTERIRNGEAELREQARVPDQEELNNPKLARRRRQNRKDKRLLRIKKREGKVPTVASYQKQVSALESEVARLESQKARLSGLAGDLARRYGAQAFGKAHLDAQLLDAQNKTLSSEIATLESYTVQGKAKLIAETQTQIEQALVKNKTLTQQVNHKEQHIRDLEEMHATTLLRQDLNDFDFPITDVDWETAENFPETTAEPRTFGDAAAVSPGSVAHVGDDLDHALAFSSLPEFNNEMADMPEHFVDVGETQDSPVAPESVDDMLNRLFHSTPSSSPGRIA